MENLALSLSTGAVPYIKELRKLAGSLSATLLMQQLDFRFNLQPNGFYKFLEPCDCDGYRDGDSWTEELGFSAKEFRTAWAQIGTTYKSRTAFNQSSDPFAGKYYCSFFDRKTGHTHFLRNHKLLDAAIKKLFEAETQSQQGVDANLDSRTDRSEFLEVTDGQFPSIYRKYNSENIRKCINTHKDASRASGRVHVHTRVYNAPISDNTAEQDQTQQPQAFQPIQHNQNTARSEQIGKIQQSASQDSAHGNEQPPPPNQKSSEPRTPSPLPPPPAATLTRMNDRGVYLMPTSGKHKLAGQLALRSSQIELSLSHLEFEAGIDHIGWYWFNDPNFAEWQIEDTMFNRMMPFRKLESILMGDQHNVMAGDINATLQQWFGYWVKALSEIKLEPGQRLTVVPTVLESLGVEPVSVEDDE